MRIAFFNSQLTLLFTQLTTILFSSLSLSLSFLVLSLTMRPFQFPLFKIPTTLLLLLFLSSAAAAKNAACTCNSTTTTTTHNNRTALNYKLAAIAAILVAGAVGVSIPLLSKIYPTLPRSESDGFFLIKAFAAGVILGTGCVHILPDAFDRLASPCLNPQWGNFPLGGAVAMAAAIGALMIDAFATGIYRKKHFGGGTQVINAGDEEHAGHVHVHTHATHGHAHGASGSDDPEIRALPELIRHRIISQVLEVGIIVHSVIIGVSLGASGSPQTIKPLLVALSFHQLFEGMGLGGCIAQAKFKWRSMACMMTFFSLTTPFGIAIGIAIADVYKKNSSTALIVEGVLNSASAGILLYMALVDLLAADFMNPRLQSNVRLQLGASLFLLLGAACMSVLAIWS